MSGINWNDSQGFFNIFGDIKTNGSTYTGSDLLGGYLYFGETGASGSIQGTPTALDINSIVDTFINNGSIGSTIISDTTNGLGKGSLYAGTIKALGSGTSVDVFNRNLITVDGTTNLVDWSGSYPIAGAAGLYFTSVSGPYQSTASFAGVLRIEGTGGDEKLYIGGAGNTTITLANTDGNGYYQFIAQSSSPRLSIITDAYGEALSIDRSTGIVSINGIFAQTQQSTPGSMPASGNNYLYFKSDNNLYAMNSSGVEYQLNGSTAANTLVDLSSQLSVDGRSRQLFGIDGITEVMNWSATGTVTLQGVTFNLPFGGVGFGGNYLYDISQIQGQTSLTLEGSNAGATIYMGQGYGSRVVIGFAAVDDTINALQVNGNIAINGLNASYWSGTPTTLQEALDRIAAVVSVGGASPIP